MIDGSAHIIPSNVAQAVGYVRLLGRPRGQGDLKGPGHDGLEPVLLLAPDRAFTHRRQTVEDEEQADAEQTRAGQDGLQGIDVEDGHQTKSAHDASAGGRF